MSGNTRPNLFDYATSELSQDAFICWVLSWLEEDKQEDVEMRALAFDMLKLLAGEDLKRELVYDQIKIYRQRKKVDIVVHFQAMNRLLLIEDKIHGIDNHKKQNSYKKKFLQDDVFNVTDEQISFAYLKTGYIDSRDKRLIQKIKNIKLVDILNLNSLLNRHRINDHIFRDYKAYINRKVTERKNARIELFEKNAYKSLKHHIGQSILADHLIKTCGIKNVNEGECYTKVANSKGGQPWIEIWITSHDGEREYEDSIFYRIEPVTRNGIRKPAITLRQYNNHFDGGVAIELDKKRKRYEKLVEAFSDLSDAIPFVTKTKYTSPDYNSSVFGTFIFDEENDLDLFFKKFKGFHDQLKVRLGIIFKTQ